MTAPGIELVLAGISTLVAVATFITVIARTDYARRRVLLHRQKRQDRRLAKERKRKSQRLYRLAGETPVPVSSGGQEFLDTVVHADAPMTYGSLMRVHCGHRGSHHSVFDLKTCDKDRLEAIAERKHQCLNEKTKYTGPTPCPSCLRSLADSIPR